MHKLCRHRIEDLGFSPQESLSFKTMLSAKLLPRIINKGQTLDFHHKNLDSILKEHHQSYADWKRKISQPNPHGSPWSNVFIASRIPPPSLPSGLSILAEVRHVPCCRLIAELPNTPIEAPRADDYGCVRPDPLEIEGLGALCQSVKTVGGEIQNSSALSSQIGGDSG